MIILAINCGSATVKYGLFDASPDLIRSLATGVIELAAGYREAVGRIVAALPRTPEAVAHRVVHGGARFKEAILLDIESLQALRALLSLAPLHNPPAIEGIEATLALGVPMVAVFDTAFHRTLPEEAWRYALPDLHGIRRYGFHGLSHQFVTERYTELTGLPEPTIITLHLGNGCSAAAVKRGRSVDTSMGFTPLEGLVMGTRPGDLDAGIVTHLLRQGMSLDDLERLLNERSGLRGLAGTSDMRELLSRSDPAARLAVEIFCHRARKCIGAYLAALEGAEAIVFTGAIGENSAEIRARIAGRLGWAGLTLDPERNTAAEGRISTDESRLHAYAIRTDEERMIAREAARCLARCGIGWMNDEKQASHQRSLGRWTRGHPAHDPNAATRAGDSQACSADG